MTALTTPHSTLPSALGQTSRGIEPGLPSAARAGLARAAAALFSHQHADGHWCAELEGDSILITEYLLMKAILGHDQPGELRPGERELWNRMLVHLRRLQREDGTWGQYPGSGPDISACVKAYFTLKLFGT